MTVELQSTLEASGIEWSALWNHVPCMAHVTHLHLGAVMSSLGVEGRTKSWEADECNQEFGENESIDIGKSQRLWKEGNARIDKVLAMRPGLAELIEKVHISRNFETPETELHIAANAGCNDDPDTWPSKRVHWLSKTQNLNRSMTDYGCKNMVEFYPGVAWVSQPISRILTWVAQES